MSSLQSNTQAARAKSREPSADNHASQMVFTAGPPPPRNIPLPDFYPTERTSTASFKAPMTSVKKKPEPLPPPPPPGTLSTAMGYISSPVRYISSMFTAPPPPEPVKVKERLFKIDLEKAKEKEKQASPRISTSLKKVQNVLVEEMAAPAKPSTYTEKNLGSAWRRKNMMDTGSNPPPSPTPQKFRAQSPKRLPPSVISNVDLTPTNISQVTISSSSATNSFKVLSKMLAEEPVKNKKKDPRKMTNGRTPKETPAVPVNFNKSNKSNTRYNPPPPSRYMVPTLQEDDTIIPYPTILPPRVPPATYTIRSLQESKPEEKAAPKEAEVQEESETEPPVATTLTPTVATSPTVTTGDQPPELLAGAALPKLKPFEAGGMSDSSIADVEEEPRLQETLGKIDIGEMVKVSRLDQLPPNRLQGGNGGSSLRGLFHDATLLSNDVYSVAENATHTAAQIRPSDLVLCSSTQNYSSPKNTSAKLGEPRRISPSKGTVMKRPTDSRGPSISPVRKRPSPKFVRSEAKQPNPPAPLSEPPKDALSKPQKPFSFTPQSHTPPKVTQPLEVKTSQTKDVSIKTFQNRKTPSPPAKGALKRRISPLRVDDKHVAAVEQSIGKSLGTRRSRMSNAGRSPDKFNITHPSRSQLASASGSKPIIKTMPKKKDPSLDRQSAVSSAINAAAVTAAATAAAAAATSLLQPHQDQDKAAKAPASSQVEPDKPGKGPSRSPPSIKADKESAVVPHTSSIRPPSPKVTTDFTPPHSGDSAAQNSSKKSKFLAAKDMIKRNVFPNEPESESVATTGYKASENQPADECEEYNCLENYCGDPAKFFKAATMMGEIP